MVVAGDIERKDSGYEITLKAVDAMKGHTIIEKSAAAGSKQDVMSVASKLATPIRKELGDKTPDAVQMAAAETYGTPSLEAAQDYAQGQDAQWAGNFDAAIKAYRRAIDLDPNMGRAYAGIAVNYKNLGNRAAADDYFKQAISKIERMSEREQLRTYAAYYLFRGNYDQASDKLVELTRKFPADDAAQSNLVYSYFINRKIERAVEAQKEVVKRKPESVFNGSNLALYEMYAGQFDAAVQQAQEVLQRNPSSQDALKAMAFSQFASGKTSDAAATYAKIGATGADGASVASIGMADIALYEGRTADAIKILEKGVDADLINKNVSAAAVKLAAMAAASVAPPPPNDPSRPIRKPPISPRHGCCWRPDRKPAPSKWRGRSARGPNRSGRCKPSFWKAKRYCSKANRRTPFVSFWMPRNWAIPGWSVWIWGEPNSRRKCTPKPLPTSTRASSEWAKRLPCSWTTSPLCVISRRSITIWHKRSRR